MFFMLSCSRFFHAFPETRQNSVRPTRCSSSPGWEPLFHSLLSHPQLRESDIVWKLYNKGLEDFEQARLHPALEKHSWVSRGRKRDLSYCKSVEDWYFSSTWPACKIHRFLVVGLKDRIYGVSWSLSYDILSMSSAVLCVNVWACLFVYLFCVCDIVFREPCGLCSRIPMVGSLPLSWSLTFF